MASIDRVGNRWRARWRTPDGRSRSKTFDRKVDAQRQLTAIESSKLAGGYVDPREGRVTVRAYAEQWRAIQVHRPNSVKAVNTCVRRVYPRLGDRPIGAVRRSDIQALIKELDGELAPRTVQQIVMWLATIFKAAVADRVITRSPCQDIKLSATGRAKVDVWPVEMVEALIDGIGGQYRPLLILGAGSGFPRRLL